VKETKLKNNEKKKKKKEKKKNKKKKKKEENENIFKHEISISFMWYISYFRKREFNKSLSFSNTKNQKNVVED